MGVVTDFSLCIGSVGETIEIIRYLPDSVVDGRVEPKQIESVVDVVASVQPMTSRELERVPEGMRTRGMVKCYSPVEIRAGDVNTGIPPDRIRHNGTVYEATKCDDWETVAGYYRVELVRVGV